MRLPSHLSPNVEAQARPSPLAGMGKPKQLCCSFPLRVLLNGPRSTDYELRTTTLLFAGRSFPMRGAPTSLLPCCLATLLFCCPHAAPFPHPKPGRMRSRRGTSLPALARQSTARLTRRPGLAYEPESGREKASAQHRQMSGKRD